MTRRWLCFWHHSEAPVGLKDRDELHCIVFFRHKSIMLGCPCHNYECITASKAISAEI